MGSIQHDMGRIEIAASMAKSVLDIIYAVHFTIRIIYLYGRAITKRAIGDYTYGGDMAIGGARQKPAKNSKSFPKTKNFPPMWNWAPIFKTAPTLQMRTDALLVKIFVLPISKLLKNTQRKNIYI